MGTKLRNIDLDAYELEKLEQETREKKISRNKKKQKTKGLEKRGRFKPSITFINEKR